MVDDVYITEEEVKSISVEEVREELNNLLEKQTNSIELILTICEHFEILLKNLNINIISSKRTGFFNLDQSSFIDSNSKNYQDIMVLGAQIVFQLRTLLLNEEITFLIATGSGPMGTQLLEKEVSQADVLKHIRASVESNIIQFDTELTRLNEQDNQTDSVLNQMWQSILNLADYSEITSKNPVEFSTKSYVYIDKNGNEHIHYRRYYKKLTRDTNVYAGYRTNHRIKYGYYKINNNTFSFLNNGWLYQWFRNITLQGADQTNKLLQSINDPTNNTPLNEMIQRNDTLPGYKGGDVAANNIQYQLKFNNLKLISFTSIITVIKNLKNILQDYKVNKISGNDKENQNLAIKLLNLFTDANNMQLLNKDYDTVCKNLLGNLNLTN